MAGIKKLPTWGYEILREGNENIMRINVEDWPYLPSIEDNALAMALTIDKLVEVPSVQRIVFVQRKNYTYDYNQTQMLAEIAALYNRLIKQKRALSVGTLGVQGVSEADIPRRHGIIQYLIFNLLRTDPLGAYVELKRVLREEKVRLDRLPTPEEQESEQMFIDLLENIKSLMGKTKLITLAKPNLEGYHIGDRSIYSLFFKPAISPDFFFTRLMAQMPADSEQLDIYQVGNAEINMLRIPNDIKVMYHLNPPEFKLSEDKYELLDLARNVVAEHQPKEEEFLEPEKMRQTFFNIGKDLITELAEQRNIDLKYEELVELTEILVRYTVGFGLIEVLIEDPKIQDLVVNGPIGVTPIFVVHSDHEECITNIIPSKTDAESWASKFRMLSGRPLDEANPVLDTELILPKARARVAIIQKPLNPFGLGYALRRHRDKPWTLPLFVKNRMISPLGAGLMSFLIDGARTLLIAGTRSSGKTSMLGAHLVEIMRKSRIITVEDTLELPTEALRKLGYNIQPMKVRSALTSGGTEVPADEGIRTSLRMGDSSLIVGEIRSTEAFALYEAMRIGALANVVAGTIHGDSPYGVYDRVVNDLKVPATSFKATDIIMICNPLKSPDGLKKWKRTMSITEVRKHWTEDPLKEAGFVDLMKYNSKTDLLEPTDDLINGESEILKGIAGNIKEWAGDWDAVWDNVTLRAKIKETLVKYSEKTKDPEMLEAPFVINSNDQFHRALAAVKEEVGAMDSKQIFFEWDEWVKKKIRDRKGF
ncbi:MAG: type II/IV secretion system ATPase subunit [Nanoarchaeota archaeon]|nr:type II/IV secretion system ATPase subunit [Nanoarchaeota archaeon]